MESSQSSSYKLAELKIKVGSLSLEQTLIRRAEEKHRGRARKIRRALAAGGPPAWEEALEGAVRTFWSLRHHRGELRAESRSAQLALAFLRGRSYATVEAVARTAPDWTRIWKIAAKFASVEGPPRVALEARWTAWLTEAQADWLAGSHELRRREDDKRGRKEAAPMALGA